MPAGGETDHGRRSDLLSFNEIERLVGIFSHLGIRRLRFTGGEPLVRRDFPNLVTQLARAYPLLELALTSNGSRLEAILPQLAEADLRSVNISIDTLRPDRFHEITRGGDLSAVRASIERAAHLGFGVKLNIVPMLGFNDDEWGALVRYAWSVGATPRFIELMPLSRGKGYTHARAVRADVEARIAPLLKGGLAPQAHAVRGPAQYVQGTGGRVGFITPLSHDFCDSCNRLRVSARGEIRACLADRRAASLRDVMRDGGDDHDVAWVLCQALSAKHPGHYFHDADVSEHHHVAMSLIGG